MFDEENEGKVSLVDRSADRTAWHEAGHILMAVVNERPIEKVLLGDEGGEMLGTVLLEEPHEVEHNEMWSQVHLIECLVAGCKAEELFIGERLDYMDGDRLLAVAVLYWQVTGKWMADEFLQLCVPGALTEERREYLQGEIDVVMEKHRAFIFTIEEHVEKIFEEDRDILEALANKLLEQGSLGPEEIMDIVGGCKYR